MPSENEQVLKLPAIRASMGDWIYYVGAMSFQQVSKYVTADISELHDTKVLSEMLQRAITNNHVDIKNYLLTQEERLFNGLVLAVYNGQPMWIDSKMTVEQEDFFDIGVLQFTGAETIFPIDGQHRIKGIISALTENQDTNFHSEQVPVIFVAHFQDEKERSRRLFSTLNRRAKAVNIRDIIVLDEDDAAAIVTRRLMEEHRLFAGERIVDARVKSIPNTNKKAFISTIALYDCNRVILKYFRGLHKKNIFNEYIKFRPAQKELVNFERFCFLFWDLIANKFTDIQTFLSEAGDITNTYFRNSRTGGSLLFRPIGLLPMIEAIFMIKRRNSHFKYSQIMDDLNSLDLNLNITPWKYVLWNEISKKMQRAHDKLVIAILLYKFELLHPNTENLKKLTDNEFDILTEMYKDRKAMEMTKEAVLNELR